MAKRSHSFDAIKNIKGVVMNIILFLLVGLIAGWLAGLIVEGHGLGTLGNMIVGIIGAFVGGLIFDIFGVTTYGFWQSVGMSAIGAVVFLFIVGLFTGSSRSTKPLGKI